MSDHKTKESYSTSLLDLPNTGLKAKIELPPEPIVKSEKGQGEVFRERAALPSDKKGLFGPKQTRDGGPRRQGMPPPGEPTPPTPPSKPNPTPPEDWENEDLYPIGIRCLSVGFYPILISLLNHEGIACTKIRISQHANAGIAT